MTLNIEYFVDLKKEPSEYDDYFDIKHGQYLIVNRNDMVLEHVLMSKNILDLVEHVRINEKHLYTVDYKQYLLIKNISQPETAIKLLNSSRFTQQNDSVEKKPKDLKFFNNLKQNHSIKTLDLSRLRVFGSEIFMVLHYKQNNVNVFTPAIEMRDGTVEFYKFYKKGKVIFIKRIGIGLFVSTSIFIVYVLTLKR